MFPSWLDGQEESRAAALWMPGARASISYQPFLRYVICHCRQNRWMELTTQSSGLAESQEQERKPILYFSPMGNQGLDIHAIRRARWKLRVAQGIGGEIYLNDRSTAARDSRWLARPELYDLEQDPEESYDVSACHPEIVLALLHDLGEQMASFSPHVVDAFTNLQQRTGNISTPPGASPRPPNQAQ